jgi:hypothetical protein
MKSNTNNNNNNENSPLKKNIIFDDNLSDLSKSLIEENEEERKGLELDQFVNDDYIEKLKDLIKNDFDKILPNDFEKLKSMNEMLYSKFNELSKNYNEILNNINANNEEIRLKAKKYYEDYKKIKNEVYKGRIELKKKKIDLKKEIETNIEQNNNLINDIENLKTETNMLKNKLNIEENKNNKKTNNNDIEILSDILKKVHNLGYDIFTGTGLTNEEKSKLKNLLGINENNNNNNKNNNNNFDNENNREDDIEFGNEIVSLIERDVNDLYLRKLIENIKIDQINAITYTFQDDKISKDVTLKIENGNLVCSDGVSFNTWLLSNFGI